MSATVAGLVHTGRVESGAGLAAQAGLAVAGVAAAVMLSGLRRGRERELERGVDDLRRRLESQVKEVAKKTRNLEALIAAMDEPLLATDQQERVLLCNRSAEAVLGGEGEGASLVGRRIDEVFTHAEALEMHAAARGGQVRRARVPLVTPLGRRVFQVSASPVPVAWGQGVFGAVMVLRDVTELDQAVQVKTEFVANASHELRTPVAAIRSAAETLKVAMEDDPAMASRVAGMIVSHAGRLEELLRDLLDLTRLESPDVPVKSEAVAIAEVEKSLRGLFEEACRQRRLRLVFDVDEELNEPVVGGVVRTDRKLLLLALRNMVENATKFAFEDTEVRVSVQLVEQDVPEDAAAGGGGRGVVRWEVSDRGVGIPLNQQERVFERFYQVDGARTGTAAGSKRGTGLGLAIVKHAVRALGGRVGLRSVWGQGTTVWVEAPVGLGGSGGVGGEKVQPAA
ncbi:MAG: sensor histidine kinase [Phycisphaerales bacterium]